MPRRTAERIGRGQPQRVCGNPTAAQPAPRILIHAVEPCRKVNRRLIIVDSGRPDYPASRYTRTDPDLDRGQIAVRSPQSPAVVDSHRQHSSDRTGECDSARRRSADRGPRVHTEVDSPMTGIVTDGSELPNDRPIDGRHQPNTIRRPSEQGGGKQQDGRSQMQFDSFLPPRGQAMTADRGMEGRCFGCGMWGERSQKPEDRRQM